MSNSPLACGDLPPEYGLLVLQAERPEQQVYVRYLMLILNYRFGLDLITVKSHMEAFSAARKYGRKIRCTVIVQDTKIDTKSTIAALNLEDAIPLIIVLPAGLIASHEDLIQRMTNVHFCAWETALGKSDAALLPLILKTFAANGIGKLFGEDAQQLPFEEMQARVERRLRNLKTLPTLPEIAVRIMYHGAGPETDGRGFGGGADQRPCHRPQAASGRQLPRLRRQWPQGRLVAG